MTALTPFEPTNLGEALALSDTLAKSALVPDALRGKPQDILLVLMTARELGIGPTQAFRSLHVVKGKVIMSADLMSGLVQGRRDVCTYWRIAETTDAKCTIETQRAGSPKPTAMTWTIEQAKAAGLTSNDNWRKHPAAMLRARCASALARAVYPDLLMGVYDHDEAREIAPALAVVPPPEPTPPPAAAPPPEDAVLEEPAADGVDATELADWSARIEAETTPEGVAKVCRELAKRYPAKHPMREAIKPTAMRRQSAVRKGAA